MASYRGLSHLLQGLLHFLFRIGYFGPFVMGILDSSFLFLPFGNDLLVVALVARHHGGYLLYVLSAVCGSTLGIFFLDLIARKSGEGGITKVAGKKRFEYLKRKIGQRGALALILGCLAPPPFPFTMAVATLSALGYPRLKLLSIVAASRCARFLILGFLAMKFGRIIITISKSPAFVWTMGVLIAICIGGSAYSIVNWVRKSRGAGTAARAAA
jgi:membrane protein YqaA with SNARE-associated domain